MINAYENMIRNGLIDKLRASEAKQMEGDTSK